MYTLSEGVLVEDFDYGYPYGRPWQQRPTIFDYTGSAQCNAGFILCPQGDFEMQFGNGSDNDDAQLPYGGAPASNPYYIRYPPLGWGQTAGIFLTVLCKANATLSFDRAFSGYVNDSFVVSVNQRERLSVTGSAGYSWTRNTITLAKGTNHIALMLISAAYAPTVVRSGTAQGITTQTALTRYFRMSNLTITECAQTPQAADTLLGLSCETDISCVGGIDVVTGSVTMPGKSLLLCPMVIADPLDLPCDSGLLANVIIGLNGQQESLAEATISVVTTTTAHHFSDTGGFGMGATASLSLINTAAVDVTAQVRSIKKVSLTLDTPSFANGSPITPLGVCETEVSAQLLGSAIVNRVDPYSPANRPPVTPTWRWLSPDAESDDDGNLTHWRPTDYAGPAWSTPGDYRPSVGRFAMKVAGTVAQVPYPAVQFDAGHLDHATANFPYPSINQSGQMTWVIIGSFARYRGRITDNCPILDYSSDAFIDYEDPEENTAVRNVYMPWVDTSASSSIYLGLASYSDKDLISSRFVYRLNDATSSFEKSTDGPIITDASPCVIIYRINGDSSLLSVTPLVAGQSGTTVQKFSRTPPTEALRTEFCLGKTRVTPPLNGSFLTGSMSLMEVSYYNTPLTDDQISALANFYMKMYTPIAGGLTEPDYTIGTLDVTGEQVLIYAADPETPLTLVSGERCVQLSIYPSSLEGQIEMQRFNGQGVPTVQVSNRDYARLVAQLELP